MNGKTYEKIIENHSKQRVINEHTTDNNGSMESSLGIFRLFLAMGFGYAIVKMNKALYGVLYTNQIDE